MRRRVPLLPGERLPGLGELHLVVPEGVSLTLELAARGERAAAFGLDALLLLAAFTCLSLSIAAATSVSATSGTGDTLLLALGWLALFVVRSGWFLLLELRGRGRSPGKRWTGLTVVDAGGGPLTTGSIVARNLTRELELWLPISLLAAPDAFLPGVELPVRLLAGAWLLLVGAFPAFHPEGARLGDLVAGTRVVRTPEQRLEPELVRATASPARARVFTREQLGVYGVYELQTLETALRIDSVAYDRRATLVEVARAIQKRLNWVGRERDVDAERFLREFYAALRTHLEGGLRLGRRKEDQYDGEARRPPVG